MSWRDRIFFLVPILGIGFWPIVFGALVLASPFLIPLLLLFLLGLAPFKWCPWLGWCYAVVAVSLLFWVWRGCSNGTTHGVPAETRALHFNVTKHPTTQWIIQQLREAFPFDSASRFLIFDRDAKYGWRSRSLFTP